MLIIDEAHHFIENFLNSIEESFTLSNLHEIKKYISNQYLEEYDNQLKILEKSIVDEMKYAEVSLQGRYKINDEMIKSLEKIKNIVNNSLVKQEARNIGRRTYYEDSYNSKFDDLSRKLKKLFDDKYVKWINYDEKKFSMISESFPTNKIL